MGGAFSWLWQNRMPPLSCCKPQDPHPPLSSLSPPEYLQHQYIHVTWKPPRPVWGVLARRRYLLRLSPKAASYKPWAAFLTVSESGWPGSDFTNWALASPTSMPGQSSLGCFRRRLRVWEALSKCCPSHCLLHRDLASKMLGLPLLGNALAQPCRQIRAGGASAPCPKPLSLREHP